ncbi:hypothetical protein SLEP1_g50947 [Rubroshorea leprosula]|uniref:Uncharacterized protein n=1 Tax=Rubroshorea leprosula TaxID=152421 RepID=A0AAV5M1M6_9ROSI|nr:hypothetical protein SLEP1_g50947 [Rubroshorea leprosula]
MFFVPGPVDDLFWPPGLVQLWKKERKGSGEGLRSKEAVAKSPIAEIGEAVGRDKGLEATNKGHEQAAGSRYLAEIRQGKAGGGDWCVVLAVLFFSSPAFFCF